MKIIHSADWHLGHRLFGQSRGYEHACFLAWLLNLLVEQEVDALLVAGDIFDTANPPTAALSQWYTFLAECQRHCPGLSVIAIGGNHDSVARLDAPRALLSALQVEIVGGAFRGGMALKPEAMCFPLCPRGSQEVAAWVAAVPFLRPSDLASDSLGTKVGRREGKLAKREGHVAKEAETQQSRDDTEIKGQVGRNPSSAAFSGDALVDGVYRFYQQTLDALETKRQPGQRALAMGHLYLRNGLISEWSERKVLGGNQHAVPADIFPEWLDYVALGHLHRAQRIGADCIRYSGSPIPMSMDERGYPHQVLQIEWDHQNATDEPVRIQARRVPRWVDMLRIPETGALPPKELARRLKKGEWRDEERGSGQSALLDEPAGTKVSIAKQEQQWRDLFAAKAGVNQAPLPWLEVATLLQEPEPGLRTLIEAALEGQPLQLAKVTVEYQGDGMSLGDRAHSEGLAALGPEEVFAHRYRQMYEDEPGEKLQQAFLLLLEEVQRGEATGEDSEMEACP